MRASLVLLSLALQPFTLLAQTCGTSAADASVAEHSRMGSEIAELTRKSRSECSSPNRDLAACRELSAQIENVRQRMKQAADTAYSQRREASNCSTDLKEARQRTAVDFLPALSRNVKDQCTERATMVLRQVAAEVQRRVGTLPPNAVRSGVVAQIEREVKAQALVVAPEWQSFWRQHPVLDEWALRSGCSIDLRFRVEAWQTAMGESVIDARNPAAIGRSEQLIAKARKDAGTFDQAQDEQLLAEAKASGEWARIRSFAFDGVDGSTTLSSIQGGLPSALCSVAGNTVSCEKPPACAADAQRAQSAQGNAKFAHLVRPLDPFAPRPAQEAANQQSATADDVLKRCMRRWPYTAIGGSRLQYAGADVNNVQLVFNGGRLEALRFVSGETASVAVRAGLTQKYGLPNEQSVTRERVETRFTASTGVTSTGQTVNLQPEAFQVVVPYTVTRYHWQAGSVAAEEETGNVLVRFARR